MNNSSTGASHLLATSRSIDDNSSPYISPVPSSELSIRERTRQAVSRHRHHRDLRRTYAGTSPSASLSPKSDQHHHHHYHGNAVVVAASTSSEQPASPLVDPIYQDIELRLQEEPEVSRTRRLDVHVPQSTSQQERRRRRQRVEESFQMASSFESSAAPGRVNASVDRARERPAADAASQKQQQNKSLNDSYASTVGTTITNTSSREQTARVTLTATVTDRSDELVQIRTNPYVYTGPFDSEAAFLMNYTTPSQQQKQQQKRRDEPIVYRDDIASSGSVVTGMSQQELLRKKARETSAKRRERKSFGKKTKRKPIVQLPASLLGSTALRISPAAGYYEKADKSSTTTRSRWNIVKGLTRSRSDDMESSTAETTHESGDRAAAARGSSNVAAPGSFAAAVAPAGVDLSRDTDEVDEDGNCQLGDGNDEDSYFPLLSTTNNSSGLLSEEQAAAAAAASAWMLSSPPAVTTTSKHQSLSADDSRASIDVSNASTTSSERRRAVRFAANPDLDEESVPWDQLQDSGKEESPVSVLDDLPEGGAKPTGSKPKSILRPSRFTPTSPIANYYYGTERRALDFESLQLADRAVSSEDLDQPIPKVDSDNEHRVLVDDDLAKMATARSSISEDIDFTRILGGNRDDSHPVILEVPPPREGFIDLTGSDISSIRSTLTAEKIQSSAVRRSAPVGSHVIGHPAEKHLRESIVSVRNMHGGGIAARVIEEDYPDPPVNIDMDDDETVVSAFVFIETVAAIVIQTAARRSLAVRRANSLRYARSLTIAKDLETTARAAPGSPSSAVEQTGQLDVSVQSEQDEFATKMYELAAVQIQSIFRGFWVRDCLDVDHYCASSIQTAYRARSCRKKYLHDLARIIIVQSWWRRNIARDLAANTLAYVIFIQAVFRGFRVRRRFKSYRAKKLRVMKIAATVIQSNWRTFAAESHFIRILVDILIVQTIVRRWLAQRQAALLRDSLKKEQLLRLSPKTQGAADSRKPRGVKTSEVATALSQSHRSEGKSENVTEEQISKTEPAKRTVLSTFVDKLQQSPADETDGVLSDRRRRNPDPPGLIRKLDIQRTVTGKPQQSEILSSDALSTSQILADIGAEESSQTNSANFWNVALTPSKSADSGDQRKSEPASQKSDAANSSNRHNVRLTPSKSTDSGDRSLSNKRNVRLTNSKSTDSGERLPSNSPNVTLTPSKSTDSGDRSPSISRNVRLTPSKSSDTGDCSNKSETLSTNSDAGKRSATPVVKAKKHEVAQLGNPWNVTLSSPQSENAKKRHPVAKPGGHWNVALSPVKSGDGKEEKHARASLREHWNVSRPSSDKEKKRTVTDPDDPSSIVLSPPPITSANEVSSVANVDHRSASLSSSVNVESEKQESPEINPFDRWHASVARSKSADGSEPKTRVVVAYPDRFTKVKDASSSTTSGQDVDAGRSRGLTWMEERNVSKSAREASVSAIEPVVPQTPPRSTTGAAASSPQRSVGTQTSSEDFLEAETTTNNGGGRPSVLSIWKEREKQAKATSSRP